MTKCDCDTDSDNSGVTEVNATHFTHCFRKIKKGVKKTCRSLWGCSFPPDPAASSLHIEPIRMWNSPPVAVQTSHIQRGEISNPRADTPSLELLLPRTECALHHYLLPAPAEASPPPHENPIIIRGHSSFSSFSRDPTPENWTHPQMNIDFFFPAHSKFLIIFLDIVLLQQET